MHNTAIKGYVFDSVRTISQRVFQVGGRRACTGSVLRPRVGAACAAAAMQVPKAALFKGEAADSGPLPTVLFNLHHSRLPMLGHT